MSALTTATTKLRDLGTLVKALESLGWAKDEIEVHNKPVRLNTYDGIKAEAHVVIRKSTIAKYGGNSYNDIGFLQQADGTIVVHAGDYNAIKGANHGKMKGDWQKQLTREYALVKLQDELETQGFFIDSIVRKDNKIFIDAQNAYL